MIKRLLEVFSIPSYTILFICMLLQGAAVSLSAPFLSLYFTEQLDVSIEVFGLFLSVTLIAGIGMSTLIGKRSDLGMNRKHIYIFATLCNACAYVGYLLIHDFYVLALYMILFTALGAPGMPQLFAIAREAVNKSGFENTTFANSTLRAAFSLGFIIGPLVGTLLIKYMGITGMFTGTIIVFLVIACLVGMCLKTTSKLDDTNYASIRKYNLIQHPKVFIPFIVLILMYSAHWMSSLNTALFITNHLSGTTSDVGLISSICAALEIPFMLMLGVLGIKYSNRAIMLSATVLGAIYYVIVIFSGEMWHLIAAQLLLAVFVAIISATGISYIQDLLPQMPGYASTLYANASTIGRLTGSLAGGFIASIVGYRYSFLFCLVLIIMAALLLLVSERITASNTNNCK